MTRRIKKQKMKKNNGTSVYSGKALHGQKAILCSEAIDYLRSLGHLVSNKAFVFLFILLFLPFMSALTLAPDNFQGWNVQLSGQEEALYNLVAVDKYQVCIRPKDITLKPITVSVVDESKIDFTDITDLKEEEIPTKEVTYEYPPTLSLYKGLTKELVLTKDVTDKMLCYSIDPKESNFYKLGENSIILSSITSFSSSDINVTKESGFSHLNVSDSSILAYYPFDSNSSSVFDYSNNNNDLSVWLPFSHTFSTSCVYGNCFYSNGSSSVYSTSFSNFIYLSNFSFSFWMYNLDNVVNQYFIFSFGNSSKYFEFYSNSNNGDYKIVYSNVTSGGEVYRLFDKKLPVNRWSFVVVSLNSTGVYVYFDSVLNQYATTPSIPTFAKDDLYIGATISNSYRFNGSIDDFIIWNRSLSSSEISQIYNAQYPKFYPEGTMFFDNLYFGTNDTVDILIPECQQRSDYTTSIYAKIGNGNWVYLKDCRYDNYMIPFTYNSSTNLTLKLMSDENQLYTPLVIGNITLDSYDSCVPFYVNLTLQDWYPVTECINDSKTLNKTLEMFDQNACDGWGNSTIFYLQAETGCSSVHLEMFTLDLESRTTMVILGFLFIFVILFLYFRKFIFAGGLLIIIGFLLLFNSFSTIVSLVIILGGILAFFLK